MDPDVARTAQLKHCARSVWALQSWTLLIILVRLLRTQIFCDVCKNRQIRLAIKCSTLLAWKVRASALKRSAVLTGVVPKSSFPLLGTRTVRSQVGHGVVRKWPLTAPLGFGM
jgi:hypothetical protein